jgi:hypothetical protein
MADLQGTLRDGQFNANGAFGSGRTASFQWRRERD